MNEERIKVSAFLIQTFAAVVISYLVVLTGFAFAWPSYNVANFGSNVTVLSSPMGTLEISLLGSMANVGALLATPLCTYALNTYGRKYTAMSFGLPFVISWTILTLTNYVPLVILAMAILGIGAAGQVASSIYIAEISQDAIRGALTSSIVTSYFLGLLMSYSWGGYFSYKTVVYVHLSLSIVYIVLLASLKESPVFLMQQGKEEEAAKSIAFYRRVDVTSKEVEAEISRIKLQLDPRIERILEEVNDPAAAMELLKMKPEIQNMKAESEWQFLRKSKSSIRAVIVALLVMAYTVLMGIIVLQVYAEPLFKEATPSMEANQCTIFLAVDFLVASFLCGALVDRLGRRYLLIVTTLASGVCLLLLGTQLQLHWAPHWLTVVLIYAYCFVYNLGPAPIPYVIAAEFFLPEVRGLCNSMVNACAWIMNFITLSIFSILVEYTGLGVVFYGFSAVSFLGAIYCYYYLPETKGLPADAIQPLFLKRKETKT
ncbi:hypothetical protein K1T71_013175 [Dendrolimus kikuchii]|uniref:Uncharacterized protein n=1 Tax=Dendrolimus kikuchii TaxID=765133 RepID=A0ACC1CJC1_9NEOP|nr:hypothetical protein K1T71_013175 [Dendrolimus kikuchii]